LNINNKAEFNRLQTAVNATNRLKFGRVEIPPHLCTVNSTQGLGDLKKIQ